MNTSFRQRRLWKCRSKWRASLRGLPKHDPGAGFAIFTATKVCLSTCVDVAHKSVLLKVPYNNSIQYWCKAFFPHLYQCYFTVNQSEFCQSFGPAGSSKAKNAQTACLLTNLSFCKGEDNLFVNRLMDSICHDRCPATAMVVFQWPRRNCWKLDEDMALVPSAAGTSSSKHPKKVGGVALKCLILSEISKIKTKNLIKSHPPLDF